MFTQYAETQFAAYKEAFAFFMQNPQRLIEAEKFVMNGLSIRKTAVACGIHRNTAFLWRHKILDALQNMADDVTLVEMIRWSI